MSATAVVVQACWKGYRAQVTFRKLRNTCARRPAGAAAKRFRKDHRMFLRNRAAVLCGLLGCRCAASLFADGSSAAPEGQGGHSYLLKGMGLLPYMPRPVIQQLVQKWKFRKDHSMFAALLSWNILKSLQDFHCCTTCWMTGMCGSRPIPCSRKLCLPCHCEAAEKHLQTHWLHTCNAPDDALQLKRQTCTGMHSYASTWKCCQRQHQFIRCSGLLCKVLGAVSLGFSAHDVPRDMAQHSKAQVSVLCATGLVKPR